jgi:serine/threonine-protein kinase ATR
MLKPYPPVLYWWFIQEFQDPHDWYDARRRFTLSAAVWSAVGHILGLGDRHTENILVDTSCGEVVHVDFDCLFDKALKLARPEVVPFRLTPNMVDAMGSVGYEGAFRGGLIETLTVLREHRELLLAILQPFLLDPVISWKNSEGIGEIMKDNTTGLERKNIDAVKNMRVIDGRLRGVYNLVNPNYKKIPRKDRGAQNEGEGHGFLPMGVEGQAHKLILEATSTENLVQMYVGWMSWV